MTLQELIERLQKFPHPELLVNNPGYRIHEEIDTPEGLYVWVEESGCWIIY